MKLDELLNLPPGNYKGYMEDIERLKYDVKIENNIVTLGGHSYKKWITITSEEPETIHSKLNISVSANNYTMFSTEAVMGMGIATQTVPAWFEYFKIVK